MPIEFRPSKEYTKSLLPQLEYMMGSGIRQWDDSGTVEVFPDFQNGLQDLDGFSHIILLCNFHLAEGYRFHVTPSRDTHLRGLFATRSPRRPNPIGFSIVRLEGIEDNTLSVLDLDILNETPVLDIKPYVDELDKLEGIRTGWLETV